MTAGPKGSTAMKRITPNWATLFLVAAVMVAFFLAQHLDGQDVLGVDAAVNNEAQHAAADVAQREKVELATRMAERDTPSAPSPPQLCGLFLSPSASPCARLGFTNLSSTEDDMNDTAISTQPAEHLPVAMGFGSLQAFEFLQRTAKAFACSTMVPSAYQAMTTKGYGQNQTTEPNPAAMSNCMIALDMSQRMNANPLMIMQNLHVIEGRPSWSSQFIIAAINNCGKFSPLRFDLEWLDEMDATYSTFEWEDRRKVEKKHKVRIKNARCVAWAIERATGERLESAPVTMEMAVNEGWYGKNGSKWKSMPDLMLRYRSAAFFGRIYAPELLMGLPTAEEVQDVFVQDGSGATVHAGQQSVPASTGTLNPRTGNVDDKPVTYPDADFTKGVLGWAKAIAAGKKTLDAVVATLESKGAVTDEQRKALADAVAALAPQDVEAKPAKTSDADAPVVDTTALEQRLRNAQDLDALYDAAALLDAITDPAEETRLTEIFDARVAELKG